MTATFSPPPAANSPVPSIIISAIGLMTAVWTAFYGWWKDANRESKRLRIWDDAKKGMDFWESRLKIQLLALSGQELEDAKADAVAEVDRIESSLRVQLRMFESRTLRPWLEAAKENERVLAELAKLAFYRRMLLLYRLGDYESFKRFALARAKYWAALGFCLFIPLNDFVGSVWTYSIARAAHYPVTFWSFLYWVNFGPMVGRKLLIFNYAEVLLPLLILVLGVAPYRAKVKKLYLDAVCMAEASGLER